MSAWRKSLMALQCLVALTLYPALGLAQSAGTMNLAGPSTNPGAPVITPQLLNAAVNAQLAIKRDSAPALAAEAANATAAAAAQATANAALPSVSAGPLATQAGANSAAAIAAGGGVVSAGGDASATVVTPSNAPTAQTLAAYTSNVAWVPNFVLSTDGGDYGLAITRACATGALAELPAGTFTVLSQITCNGSLKGAGIHSTILSVTAAFSHSATGVLVLGGAGPQVSDLAISLQQPVNQTARSNFITLTAGCTSGSGGTGCRYPPAISVTVARAHISHVQVAGAWDGIIGIGNVGGIVLDNDEVGALDIGYSIDGAQDYCRLSNDESWPFGLTGGTTVSSVYEDNNTVALNAGICTNWNVANFTDFAGQVNILADNAFVASAVFSNLDINSANASLHIAGGFNTISGLTALVGSSTQHTVTITGGNTTFTGATIVANSSTAVVSQTGGEASWIGGQLNQSQPYYNAYVNAGGTYISRGVLNVPNTICSSTTNTPFISDTSGVIDYQDNTFTPATASCPVITITTDNANNVVSNNNLAGSVSSFPTGGTGVYLASASYLPTANPSTVGGIKIVSPDTLGKGGGAWTNAFTVFGPNAGSTTGAALALGYDATDGAGLLNALQPGSAWLPMDYGAASHNFFLSGGATAVMTLTAGGLATTAGITAGGGLLSQGFLYGNKSGAVYPGLNTGLAEAYNFTASALEGDFWNTEAAATTSFNWYQQTGASASTLEMSLGSGVITLPNTVGNKVAYYTPGYGVGVNASDLATYSGGGFSWRENSIASAALMNLTAAGALSTTGQLSSATSIASTTYLQHGVTTVAALPTCNSGLAGAHMGVTDATSPTFLGALTGGGSVKSPVYCNGTAWVAG